MKNTHSMRGVYLALVVSSGGYGEGGLGLWWRVFGGLR